MGALKSKVSCKSYICARRSNHHLEYARLDYSFKSGIIYCQLFSPKIECRGAALTR